MALTNYTTLQASIADWLNRTDLTSQIKDFITLSEAKFKRSRSIEFTRRVDFTVATEVVNLPTDLRELQAIGFDDTIRFGPIEIVSSEQLALKKSQLGNTGFPRFAAIVDNGTALKFAPAPDQTYTVPIEYDTVLEVLSDTQASNWLLDDYPDIYLFGSLVQAEKFLKNDERVPTWKTSFDEALAELDDLIERRKFSANTPVRRPRRAIG